MAKNRNQNSDRAAAPSRSSDPGGEQSAVMEPQQAPASSGMAQELSRKRKKKFGHN